MVKANGVAVAVDQNSIGARLDARGLTHRQVCRDGKHLVEVYATTERVFSGSRQDLETWLCDFGAQYQFKRAWGRLGCNRAPFRITRRYGSGLNGLSGWASDSAFAFTAEEAEALRASAKKIGGLVTVESL